MIRNRNLMDSAKKTIVIVGAGQIGSRHLQALSSFGLDCRIEVFDLLNSSLEVARARFDEVYDEERYSVEVIYSDDISSMSRHVDLIILATPSKGREWLLQRVLANSKIENMILEKVLFQNPDSYEKMNTLLKDNKVRCWVNCWPRTMPFYRDIREKIKGSGRVDVSVSGERWGLGCNSAHFLDLFYFLTGGSELKKVNCELSEIYEAKRKGYIDFTGQIDALNVNGDKLTMNDAGGEAGFVTVKILANNVSFELIDQISDMKIIECSGGKESVSLEQVPYQSQRTGLIARDIITDHRCDLPLYADTCNIHEQLIRGMIVSLNQDHHKGYALCPIT